jgi:hypothetical protein
LRVSDETRGRQLPGQTSFCAARLRPTVCSACFASRSYAVAMNCSRRRASAWVIFAAVLRASSASRRQCPASYSGGTHSPGLPHGSNAKASVRFRRELHEWLRRFSRGRGEHRGHLRQLEQHDGITSSPRAGAQDQCATRHPHSRRDGARSAGRTSCSRNFKGIPRYPATIAIPMPTLTTDRPPTIEVSQASSRASVRTDFHIGVLPPLLCTSTAAVGMEFPRAFRLSTTVEPPREGANLGCLVRG